MKKTILLTLLLATWCLFSFSQLLQEDFESGFSIFVNAPGNTSNFKVDSNFFVSGRYSAYDSSMNNHIDTLYSSSVLDLTTSTNPYLSFWHIAKLDSSDNARVLLSTDSGITYSPLPISIYRRVNSIHGYHSGLTFNENSYPDWELTDFPKQSWWKKESFDLSSFTSFDKVKIAFVLDCDATINKKGWYLDDILVENRSCSAPYFLSSFGTTEDSTNITWLNGGNDSLWQIQYDTIGFPIGSGTISAFSSKDTSGISSLSPSKLYHVYLRSICKSGDTSSWQGPLTFRTSCDTIDFGSVSSSRSYHQNFNLGVSFDNLCWSEAYGNYKDTTPIIYGTSQWQMNDYENNPSKSISAKLNLSNSDIGQWLISPLFYFGPDPNYTTCISFNVVYTDSSSQLIDTIKLTDTLFILYSLDGGVTWNDKGNVYTKNYLLFSSNDFRTVLRHLTGTVKFALYFKKNNPISNGDLFVDNVIIEHGNYKPCWWSSIAENEQEENSVSLFPNPANSRINIEFKNENSSFTDVDLNIYSIQGQLVKKLILSNSKSQLFIGELTKGIYIFKFSFENGKTENHRIVVY